MTRSSSHRKIVGIILAGGQGTRLFGPKGGSKGLFIINGRPLIDYSLSAIKHAGIDEIAVVVRETDYELRSTYTNYVQISDSGVGTLSAVLAGAAYAAERQADAIISSCDLVCAPMAAKTLLDALSENPEWLASFGVTSIANDQAPIWVHSDESGRVRDYGKGIQPSRYAFASIRFASLNFLEISLSIAKTVSNDTNTDTKLMRHLIVSMGLTVGAINVGCAIDVDDAIDAKIATDISQSFG